MGADESKHKRSDTVTKEEMERALYRERLIHERREKELLQKVNAQKLVTTLKPETVISESLQSTTIPNPLHQTYQALYNTGQQVPSVYPNLQTAPVAGTSYTFQPPYKSEQTVTPHRLTPSAPPEHVVNSRNMYTDTMRENLNIRCSRCGKLFALKDIFYKCESQHTSCDNCFTCFQHCTVCGKSMLQWKQEESNAQMLQFQYRGRQDLGRTRPVQKFVSNYKKKCPLNNNCTWKGDLASELESHAQKTHTDLIQYAGKEISISDLKTQKHYVYYTNISDSKYLLHLNITSEFLFLSVQHLEMSDNVTYDIQIYQKNANRRKITFNDSCVPQNVPINNIFKEFNCLAMPLSFINTYVNNDNLLTFKFYIMKNVKKNCDDNRNRGRGRGARVRGKFRGKNYSNDF